MRNDNAARYTRLASSKSRLHHLPTSKACRHRPFSPSSAESRLRLAELQCRARTCHRDRSRSFPCRLWRWGSAAIQSVPSLSRAPQAAF